MSAAVPSARRRLAIVSSLAGALALGGLASVAVRAPSAGHATLSTAGGVRGIPGSTSTQWSCAGPLPVADPKVSSSIELTNSSKQPIDAAVTFSSTKGRPATEHVVVVPGVPLVARPGLRARGMAAARVLADGGGLSVVEIIHGPSGPIEAPCTAVTSTTEYLVAGDTRRSDDIALSLYDPGATPAVASVSFATASGRQSPPTFQGVPVGAGQLVVLTVANRLPFAPEVAMTVRTSGGSLAVGALDSTRLSGSSLEALEVGGQTTSSRWLFAAAPAGPAASQLIDLLNPSKKAAKVDVGYLALPRGPKVAVVVPPGGLARVALNSEPQSRALGAALVTSTNGVAVVAGRELRVATAISQAKLPERNPTLRRLRALLIVPRVGVAYTITGGVVRPAKSWVIGGGEADKAASELVTVTNPTPRRAIVEVVRPGRSVPYVHSIVVAPFASDVIDFADVSSATGRFSIVVVSTEPVIATGSLYDKGSVGFTSSAAIPLD